MWASPAQGRCSWRGPDTEQLGRRPVHYLIRLQWHSSRRPNIHPFGRRDTVYSPYKQKTESADASSIRNEMWNGRVGENQRIHRGQGKSTSGMRQGRCIPCPNGRHLHHGHCHGIFLQLRCAESVLETRVRGRDDQNRPKLWQREGRRGVYSLVSEVIRWRQQWSAGLQVLRPGLRWKMFARRWKSLNG